MSPEITERDEKGRIKKVKFAEGERQEFGQRGGSARSFTKQEQDELYREIITDKGFDPETAPAKVRWAAWQAVFKSSIPGMNYLDSIVEDIEPVKGDKIELQVGDRCPCCGFYLLSEDQRLGNDIIAALKEKVAEDRKKQTKDERYLSTLAQLREEEKKE